MRTGFNVHFAVKVGCDGKDGGNNKAGRKGQCKVVGQKKKITVV